MILTLQEAAAGTCGGKAAVLAALLREGLPVPDGFVVPFAAHRSASADPQAPLPRRLRDQVAAALRRLGDSPVAVRSSAANEDTAGASAAGQYESSLAVEGVEGVLEAIGDCWASASSERVAAYRSHAGVHEAGTGSEMAVLVQRHIDAEAAGVMFTPSLPGEPTRIEASWGLGIAVVSGTVSPDAYEVGTDEAVGRVLGHKAMRVDRDRNSPGVITHDVPQRLREEPALADADVVHLASLGARVAGLLGGAQDIEWAVADGRTWLLQARPVTAPLPTGPSRGSLPGDAPASGGTPSSGGTTLHGVPSAQGTATGTACVIRSPSEFGRVRKGSIVICPYTDPAWTPLFTVAGGIVTEVGGALSHAAIVAREYGLPAITGLPRATERIPDGARLTIDGAAGTITIR
ncbi:pyruvate, phosphate dikinase [Kocuria coralli]|uniref:Pyruvate, phosphate dikinase n=1 Tax=Kocuria coralli TaxID=1461025 RepID=A0A5J5KVF0_9MICC|nr:PEP/pyruvate-binding domain-containing protein [Kocuria coralli]KAA9393687.1 pyruvate, phosphate dikinase [Kocuria coralli]